MKLDLVRRMTSRKFLLSAAALGLGTWLCFGGQLDGTTWAALAGSLAGAYQLGNVMAKRVESAEE